ncbi:hypothetical protein RI129_010633 [Pyrocoelia pectoralis]|uniref:glutathione transferase n=1 Tax=Pyrocoelia pectoralis TaxID=417401 RepID=A0AAN7V297_9COLE
MCDNCGSCEACDLKRSHKCINILANSEELGDSQHKCKLIYFPFKALAEPIRFLLHYCEIEFDDVRIPKDEWDQHKQSTPFGQVPVLEINGQQINQSLAICRYLGKRAKLTGSSDVEDLEIDAMADTINDFRGKIAQYHYETNSEVKENRKTTLYAETLPFYLDRFEEIAKKNGGHLALGKLTWVDFYFTGLLDYLDFMLNKSMLEDYPNLKEVENNVVNLTSINKWIEERPKTDL